MPRRRVRALARALVAGMAGFLVLPWAQRVEAQARQLARADSLPPRFGSAAAVLSRTIALSLNEATVEQALRAISEAADLRLAYSSDILPWDVRVTLPAGRFAVGDVIKRVLASTGLDVVVSPSGYVIVVRSPSPRVTASSPGTVPLVVPRADLRLTRPQIMDRLVVMGTPVIGAPERSLATAVTVRSGPQLTSLGSQGLGQLFRTGIPGVVAWDLGIAGPLAQIGSVRGSSSFTSNYLKTYLDGVELASPYLLFAIDAFSLERLEVIRGPQGSALYGSDAISGVVQVVTRKGSPSARWRPQVDAQASVGRQESDFLTAPKPTQRHSGMVFTGGGTTSLGFGGTWEELAPAAAGGAAGARGMYGGGRTVVGPLRLDVTGRFSQIRFNAPDNPLFSLGVGVQTIDAARAIRPLLAAQRIENETYGITADYQPSTAWRHTLVVGMDRHAGAIPPQREPATVADALLGATQEEADKRSVRYSMVADVLDRGGTTVTVTAGAEHSVLRRERLGATADVTGQGDGYTPLYGERVSNTGLFAQVKASVNNNLFISAGLRREDNSNFGAHVEDAFAPMLGVAWTRDLGAFTLKARSAYGKGIRPPAPSMKMAIRTIGYRQLANPDLGPETQSGLEGGLELYAGDAFTISTTAYTQNANGLIQQVIPGPVTSTRTIQYQNVGHIRNRGFEVEASAHRGFLRADAALSLTDSRVRRLSPTYTGELTAGDQVPEVPQSTGVVSLSSERGRGRVMGGVSYIGPWIGYDWVSYYASKQTGSLTRPLLRSYWTRYPSLTRPFLGAGWTFSRTVESWIRIDNLTNVQRNERDNLQLTAGRTITVGGRIIR